MSDPFPSLTTSSVLLCPHGGVVTASATSPPVLKATDVFIVSGCAFRLGSHPSPCIRVQWVQPFTGPLDRRSIGLCLTGSGIPLGPVLIASV